MSVLFSGAHAGTHVLGGKILALDPSTDTLRSGYYAAATLSAVDTDLAAGNIKNGVTIFGKLGGYTTGYAAYVLPDTGQLIHSSTATGDDSDYRPAVTQLSYTIYNPVGVSSVTVDNRTGLMWITNPVDAGIGGPCTWENALLLCEGLNYATYTDWRVPNVNELQSITNYQVSTADPDPAYFKGVTNWYYWSSTTYVTTPANAFTQTSSMDKTNAANTYLRCVRGGL